MLCSACSRSFDGTAKFCSGCGQPLATPVYVQGPPLMRQKYGRMISGVCAGFAATYGWDVTLVRLFVCVAGLCSAGTVLIAYVIAWIIMPVAPMYAWPMPVPPPPTTTGVAAS